MSNCEASNTQLVQMHEIKINWIQYCVYKTRLQTSLVCLTDKYALC